MPRSASIQGWTFWGCLLRYLWSYPQIWKSVRETYLQGLFEECAKESWARSYACLAGEELTFDYAVVSESEKEFKEAICLCSTHLCRWAR